ncbi:MAG: GerAB/ArcD/ProY family transporter [Clostridia bacterium]|nr:GerAB/ArcD/ProY family transporter [Clostridia bacterium]
MENIQKNKIYEEQFLLLAFISIVTFKIVMLPQYLVSTASNNSYMVMIFMVAIEIMMLTVVYGVAKNGSILEQDVPKWLKGALAILVFASSIIKCTVRGSEGIAYISTSLYANVSWAFITLALVMACVYIAQKGGKVLARSAQIFFWIIAFAVAFFMIFSQINLDPINLMPFKISGDLAIAGDKYLMWFCDFTPLLFVTVVPSKNHGKKRLAVWTSLAILCVFLFTVGLMLIFICTFGNAGELMGNAFLNVSSLNKIFFMIGSADLPTVLSWLVMYIVKFSLLLFAMSSCAKFFFGDKAIVALICGAIVFCIICFGIGNLNANYQLATSWLRYFIVAIEFAVTATAYIAMRISQSKKQKQQNAQSDNLAQPNANQTDRAQGEI